VSLQKQIEALKDLCLKAGINDADIAACAPQCKRSRRLVAMWPETAEKGNSPFFRRNFWPSENCPKSFFLSENFRLKMQYLGPKTPLKILSTYNYL